MKLDSNWDKEEVKQVTVGMLQKDFSIEEGVTTYVTCVIKKVNANSFELSKVANQDVQYPTYVCKNVCLSHNSPSILGKEGEKIWARVNWILEYK